MTEGSDNRPLAFVMPSGSSENCPIAFVMPSGSSENRPIAFATPSGSSDNRPIAFATPSGSSGNRPIDFATPSGSSDNRPIAFATSSGNAWSHVLSPSRPSRNAWGGHVLWGSVDSSKEKTSSSNSASHVLWGSVDSSSNNTTSSSNSNLPGDGNSEGENRGIQQNKNARNQIEVMMCRNALKQADYRARVIEQLSRRNIDTRNIALRGTDSSGSSQQSGDNATNSNSMNSTNSMIEGNKSGSASAKEESPGLLTWKEINKSKLPEDRLFFPKAAPPRSTPRSASSRHHWVPSLTYQRAASAPRQHLDVAGVNEGAEPHQQEHRPLSDAATTAAANAREERQQARSTYGKSIAYANKTRRQAEWQDSGHKTQGSAAASDSAPLSPRPSAKNACASFQAGDSAEASLEGMGPHRSVPVVPWRQNLPGAFVMPDALQGLVSSRVSDFERAGSRGPQGGVATMEGQKIVIKKRTTDPITNRTEVQEEEFDLMRVIDAAATKAATAAADQAAEKVVNKAMERAKRAISDDESHAYYRGRPIESPSFEAQSRGRLQLTGGDSLRSHENRALSASSVQRAISAGSTRPRSFRSELQLSGMNVLSNVGRQVGGTGLSTQEQLAWREYKKWAKQSATPKPKVCPPEVVPLVSKRTPLFIPRNKHGRDEATASASSAPKVSASSAPKVSAVSTPTRARTLSPNAQSWTPALPSSRMRSESIPAKVNHDRAVRSLPGISMASAASSSASVLDQEESSSAAGQPSMFEETLQDMGMDILEENIDDSGDDADETTAELEQQATMSGLTNAPGEREERKKKPRPCNKKRERHRKLIKRLIEQQRSDPLNFDIRNAELPPSYLRNPELVQRVDTRVRCQLLRESRVRYQFVDDLFVRGEQAATTQDT